MFIYKISSIDKLLTIAKNRDYVQNNPELCKLLENPLLKDDIELAIKYNEYKANYPNAGKDFVDYFYTHGPELDTGTLVEWRDIIERDPELLEYAKYNDTQIETIWENKKKNKDYSWLNDIYDCLSKPCQYLGMISPSIGSLADTQAKYSNKNTTSSDNLSLLGIPTYMVNKMPKYITQGIMQLTDMIAQQSADVLNTITSSKGTVKEDPYIIKNSELIGGDILSEIASRMGDCFRIYEYQKRFNPYNYEQNQEKANSFGTVVYDKNGKGKLATPNGNSAETNGKSQAFSNNNRLNHNSNATEIIASTIGNVDDSNAMPFVVTIYNGAVVGNKFYGDDTSRDPKHGDKDGDEGLTCNTANTGIYIVPSRFLGCKELSKKNVNIRCGAATNARVALIYYKALLKSKFPNAQLPNNFAKLLEQGWRTANLNVTLFFPNGQRTFPVFDTGSGAEHSRKGIPWVDITSQYFVTEEGKSLGKIISSKGPINVDPVMPSSLHASALADLTYEGKVICLDIAGAKDGIVRGLYFFSNDFCIKHGLDPSIYGNPGEAKPVAQQVSNTVKTATN